MNVTGGASSFGGSVFTGVTLGDREVVVTVKPTGSANKSIKNRLNALISRSTLNPLNFKVNTEREDGTTSSLRSDAYISGVSSPIFDKDDTVQITLKMPQSFLERGPLMLGSWGTGNLSTIPISVVRSNIYGDRHSILYSIPLGFDNDSLNAESPFAINLQTDIQASGKLQGITLRDGDMNKVILNVGDAIANSELRAPRYTLEYNGRGRTVNSYLNAGSAGTEDLRNQFDYSYFVEPNWPSIGPATDGISLEITLSGQYVGEPLDAIEVKTLIVWPRVLGV